MDFKYVWRTIALECLFVEWKRETWPATRRGLLRDTSVTELMRLWAIDHGPRKPW